MQQSLSQMQLMDILSFAVISVKKNSGVGNS